MGKMIFSRKKSTFLLGGWDGGRFGEEVGKLRGGRGEAPLHFLAESFGGGTAKAAFSGQPHQKTRKNNDLGITRVLAYVYI